MIRRRVPIGIDANGAPIMKQIKGNSEYEVMLKAGKTMLASGVLDPWMPEQIRHTPKDVPTFAKVAERWYKVTKADNPKLKPATKNDYRRLLDRYLLPSLGRKRIDKITTSELQELLNGISNVADSTQKRIILTMKLVFEMAIQEEYIVKNPARAKLNRTGAETKEGRALTEAEWIGVQAKLQDMQVHDRLLTGLLMYEGLRRGEALGLTWENIDFEANAIHITQQAMFNGNSNIATIQSPKTKTSKRTIPLVEPLKTMLQEVEPKGKYVVGNRDEPYTYSMLTKAWRRIRKTTGIRDLHPHMFRYSHATRLHELGVDDKSIQHWEGHASQDTTTKIYIKQTNDRTERAGKILSNFALEADPRAHLVPFWGEDENAESAIYKNTTEYANPMRT